MTAGPPQGPPLPGAPPQAPPSERDLEAIRKLQEHVEKELPHTRTRADRWVSAITTITGVLTTAALIKGPDTFAAISERNVWWILDPRLLVLVLLGLGGVALVVGLYQGYSAASGSPIFLDAISVLAADPMARDHGAAEKWIRTVGDAVSRARRALATAVIATLVGMVLLVSAVVYASYAPAEEKQQDVCGAIQLQGQLPAATSGTIVFAACPAKP